MTDSPDVTSPATGRPGAGLLLTDLYQLNMLQAYHDAGMTEVAVFEFFVRKLPEQRNFFVAAGLEQVLAFLEDATFTEADLAWLRNSGRFSEAFLDTLSAFRFTGDVDAMAEGTVFFPDEPILRVAAPLPQAQLVETRIINLLHFQTVVASKAARMRLAAPDAQLIDFGLRRAHGAEAGILSARAAYLAGFDGTATVPAGEEFGIRLSGTMAHSFIQAHDDETRAFLDFARARPDAVVLLIDTYDTEAGARKVVGIAETLRAEGITIRGVRLDSGDLAAHARAVRRILDDGGLGDVRIIASGGIDEYELDRLTADGAPIDGYGVGTSLATASDAPALDCAYKLQEYAGTPKRKRSEGKATWPGRKQVFRRFGPDGAMTGDTIALLDDDQPGEPLLQPVMRGGRRLGDPVGLKDIRAHALKQMECLPPSLREIAPAPTPYSVAIAPDLKALAERMDREQR